MCQTVAAHRVLPLLTPTTDPLANCILRPLTVVMPAPHHLDIDRSTYVGCPDERRIQNPFRRRFHKRGSGSSKGEFSLFDLLDVNRGASKEEGENAAAEETSSVRSDEDNDDEHRSDVALDSSSMPDVSGNNSDLARGASFFAALFESYEAKQASVVATSTNLGTNKPGTGPAEVETHTDPPSSIVRPLFRQLLMQWNRCLLGHRVPPDFIKRGL